MRRRAADAGIAAFSLMLGSLALPGSLGAQAGGEADIAVQGYYLGGNSQPVTALSGIDVSFREFLPALGLITGNIEGYNETTRGRIGQNYATLNGLRWKGRRWTITGGDFRFRTDLVSLPFVNYAYPDIGVRGAKVAMTDGPRQYTLFWGEETLQEGPRISFRVGIGQNVLGATVKQTFASKLEVAVRYLGLASSEQEVAANPVYFPIGSEFRRSDSISVQSSYHVAGGLSFFSDASVARVAFADTAAYPRSEPFSWLAGARWQTKKLTLVANYGSLSRAALPLPGYYFGDRKGPFAELKYKLAGSFELFDSALGSTNNLERNPFLPDLSTHDITLGANATLPGRVNVSGQYSKLGLTEVQAIDPSQNQNQKNSQMLISMSRTVKKHNLTLLARDLSLSAIDYGEKQKSLEIQDNAHYAGLGIGGAVRAQQQSGAGELQNSMFFRGNLDWRFRRMSVYGQFETGNDLVNKTLFATNSVNTTVAGISIPVRKGWTLQAEAFRTRLISTLNPINILMLQSQGTGVADLLNNFNQWSFFLRLTQRTRWGAPLPEEIDRGAVKVYGAVEGFVYDDATGSHGAPGVSVRLDQSRSASTDEMGHYRFADVPEGRHSVELDLMDLAADLSPGPAAPSAVGVKPRGVARADLRVVKAGSAIVGTVRGIAKDDEGVVRLENIVVDLSPAGTYTTCDNDEAFGFFNLTPGEYSVSLDKTTLPENYVLVSQQEVRVELSGSGTPPPIVFQIEKRVRELPVRKVFEGRSQ
jgi:hypothetical protein